MTHYLFIKSKSKRFKRLEFFILFLMFTVGMNAQITVSGSVSDADGPIPGVNVVLKGTNNGTTTNFDGNYTISNVPSSGVLVFSFMGYNTAEVAVNNQTTINVQLDLSTTTLEEVVVVGYGTMERGNVTGAITTVDVEAIEKTPVPNVVEALRGQVSGLRITKTSGQPGSGVSFKIRGTNSFGGTTEGGNVDEANQATIVVDGVPIVGGNLAELNPDDIESVNILKDAASAAIYGASGANGVVLITTKSGKTGKSEITVKGSVGMINIANELNMMNGEQYLKYRFDSEVAAGNTTATVNSLLDANEVANYIAGKDVDWQDVLLRTGISNNLSLTASGGTEKFHFYLSGDMYTEDGIVVESDYKRYSVRFNGDYSAKDWLKIGARVQLTKSFADETSNVISEFNIDGGFAPFIPISNNTPLGDVYDADGNLTKFIRNDRFQINPLHRYKESVIDRNVTRSYINPYVDINIMKGLKYTLNTYAENRDEFYGEFQSTLYDDQKPSFAQIRKNTNVSYLVDNIVNYTKELGKHDLDVTLVYGFQKYEYEQLQSEAENIPTNLLSYNALGDAVSSDSRTDWQTNESGKVYYIGRVGYSFDNRYNATFTIRRDGSSKFGSNKQWGNFPSASFAWNAHNENFWGPNNKLNLLKLRLSYGETGNDNFPAYYYRASTQNIQIGVGVDPETGEEILFNGYGVGTRAANPNLKWEASKQFNVGVDFGLFNNRLSGSVDYYKTNTTDLLLFETIIPAANSGFEFYPSNIGETENKGLEINLKGNIIQTSDFTWNASVNWATDKNKIVKLSRADVNEDGKPIDNVANGWFIGQDIQEIYDYKYKGVWQFGEEEAAAVYGAVPGDPKIADINGDNVIDSDDRTFLGNPTPDWYGGITNTFTYKGFELSVLVEVVEGVTRVNNFYGGYSGRNNAININYWTPDNPSNEFPRVGTGGAMSSGNYTNAIKVQDASFVALRNVSLGYALPKKYLDNTPLSDLSLFIRGNNLKYFTDYDDAFSPESSIGSYPITRTWSFGVKASF
ncbi:TonB-dependent receptor [Lutibacter sp. B1]|uniref:SusC/RagA family TonB-linked outer membrane protein n=1 Tax=Lutibacter sp. B1 TaxID=2725996 RepID=UPI0014577C09|nr:TonB-dependent receptor [Lutibacter sp. B1]NLP57523.1 TonB-dependent receptor [Lutibacter sp. B1]